MAVFAGTKISNGVLLGTSVGGGMVYIEPGTVSSSWPPVYSFLSSSLVSSVTPCSMCFWQQALALLHTSCEKAWTMLALLSRNVDTVLCCAVLCYAAATKQVVSLNNELMSARAEALSAEEAVLWDLSARLMGVLDDVQQVKPALGFSKPATKPLAPHTLLRAIAPCRRRATSRRLSGSVLYATP